MRADDEVDVAPFQSAENLLLLLGGAEAGEKLNAEGVRVKPRRGCLEVLPRQNSGRHKNRALPPLDHALEGRAEGDLGLAEAHVAAEQTIHGNRTFHVVLDFLGCLQLVEGLGVFKPILEFALPIGVAVKGVALGLHALRVNLHQLVGDVLDVLLNAALLILPFV